MNKHFYSIIYCLSVSCVTCFSQIQIRGIVMNKDSSAISGAAIVLNNTKIVASTDAEGKFVCVGKVGQNLCATALGHTVSCIEIAANLEHTIVLVLEEKAVKSDEVIISSQKKEHLVRSAETGVFELRLDSLKQMPSIAGEVDPIKMLQLTPGVSTSDLGMGINVRGGSVDQNLVLLDDAVVYNPTHLMGILSVFNPQIVKKVSLTKSGIPAYFGGRLSSVTEVETDKTIPEKTQFSGNSGLLLSDFSIKTPLLNNKAGLIIAARSSYLDYTIKPISRLFFKNNRSLFNNTRYGFSDCNILLNLALSFKDRLSFGVFAGTDNFTLYKSSFNLNIGMAWTNASLWSRWVHSVNSNYLFKTSLAYTYSDFNFIMGQSDFNFSIRSKIKDLSFIHEHTLITEKSIFKAGFQLVNQFVIPNQSKARLNDLNANFGTPNIFNTYTLSAYFHSEINITDNILVMFGLRANQYMQTGPFYRFIRKYNLEITDTVYYSANKIVQMFRNIEPRFSVRYLLNNSASVKASVTNHVQYLHQVNVSSVSLPTDFWMPSNEFLPPQLGWQYALGYYKTLNNNDIELTFETFYKTMDHAAEFNKGIVSTTTKASMEENLVLGRGRAYGIELMVRKNSGLFSGWISYTLSHSERIFEQINGGEPYPVKNDRLHDLSIVSQTQLNSKWKATAVFVLASGNAVTLPNGRYIIAGNPLNQYTDYNAYRLPVYHRLDLAFSRNLKKKNGYEHNLNLSIYNVYSRLNPFFVYFSVTGDLEHYQLNVKPRMVSVFPCIPSVSYEFKF